MKRNSQEVVLQVLILMRVIYARKIISAKMNGNTYSFLTGALMANVAVCGSNVICNCVEPNRYLGSIRSLAVARTYL